MQKAELYAIILLLTRHAEALNIVTDSQYVEYTMQHIEESYIPPSPDELTELFTQLQNLILLRQRPLFITPVRAHTLLPGPVTAGNQKIDQLLIHPVITAQKEHALHHCNAKALPQHHQLTCQQATHY